MTDGKLPTRNEKPIAVLIKQNVIKIQKWRSSPLRPRKALHKKAQNPADWLNPD